MLAQRRRRWANINQALGQRVVFNGYAYKYHLSRMTKKRNIFRGENSSVVIQWQTLASSARSCDRPDNRPIREF